METKSPAQRRSIIKKSFDTEDDDGGPDNLPTRNIPIRPKRNIRKSEHWGDDDSISFPLMGARRLL